MAKPTLQSKAYQMILDKIISGEFQPGAEMREAPLAQALGISVTPIREALRGRGGLKPSPTAAVSCVGSPERS